MTKARDTANIVGGGFSGTIAGATMEPTGDTAAGDNAAMGFTAAEGLILTGQGSTNDVTIKNDADADVIEIPTGTVNVTMAGTLGVTGVITGGGVTVGNAVLSEAELEILDGATVTTGELNLIDGGTARGTTAIADGDGVLVNDAGTMRMTNVTTLATYMGTKIGGGMEFIASSGELSSAASASFTGFDSSKYDTYVFYLNYVKPATDAQKLLAHASVNGGGAYDTTNGNYHSNGSTDKTGFVVNPSTNAGNASAEYGIVGELRLFKPHASTYTTTYAATVVYDASGGMNRGADGDHRGTAFLSTNEVNAVQFKFGSGNIASGEIIMFGIVNS